VLLILESISKSYGVPDAPGYIPILKGLEFALDCGEQAVITGPSGSGKSTLLNLIGALDHPDSGQVLINNENLRKKTEAELAEYRNREIGFVFQNHHLLPQLTLLDNVMLPTVVLKDKVKRSTSQRRALDLLDALGVADRSGHLPGQLSGGECQRAAVARALINSPALLLADEPTGSLDRENAQQLTELLLRLNAEFEVALLIVTHSEILAAQIPGHYYLCDGQLEKVRTR